MHFEKFVILVCLQSVLSYYSCSGSGTCIPAGNWRVHDGTCNIEYVYPLNLLTFLILVDTTIKEEMAGKSYKPADDPELDIYDPFGKGGAGAPLKDTRGNVVTSIYGKMQNEVMVFIW